ncbi:MAG: FkbM family methyltransferase [Deltaproteobacteria bacterium]|nr:FkbM family methyltransferase [Deltaproteobacteria bacterium]
MAEGLSRLINLIPGMSGFLLGRMRRYAITHTLDREKLRRLAFWIRLIIRSRGREIISTPSGLRFNAFDQSQYVNQILLLKGTSLKYCWEPNCSRLLNSLIHEDDRVVVAGANIGFEALLIGDRVRRGTGICYAFEPISGTFKTLLENIDLNQLKGKVTPFNFALGESDGETPMLAAGPNSSLLFLDSDKTQEKVTVRSLDSLYREGLIASVSAMIADVEGFELEMVLGGRNLLKNSPVRFFLFEVNGKTEEISPGKTKRLFIQLAEWGFDFYAITDDYRGYQKPGYPPLKLIKIKELQFPFVLQDRWFNVLALKSELKTELKHFPVAD